MDNSNSKILLDRAIKILDYANIDISSWAIGGGTVLAHYYNHRLSKLPDGLRYIGKEMEICMSLEKELQKKASGN